MIDLRAQYANSYPRRPLAEIDTIVYHHSVTRAPSDDAEARQIIGAIDHYHRVDRGWPGIGYHFAITPFREVYWLNGLDVVSNHVAGENHRSLGVVFLGTFTLASPADAALWAAAANHVEQEFTLGRDLGIVGHREWNADKPECPSRIWDDWKPTLVRRIRSEPKVRVLPYLDTAWGLSEQAEQGATAVADDLDRLAEQHLRLVAKLEEAADQVRVAGQAAGQIRDYLLRVKRGAGLM